jgi:hypothetical protein
MFLKEPSFSDNANALPKYITEKQPKVLKANAGILLERNQRRSIYYLWDDMPEEDSTQGVHPPL